MASMLAHCRVCTGSGMLLSNVCPLCGADPSFFRDDDGKVKEEVLVEPTMSEKYYLQTKAKTIASDAIRRAHQTCNALHRVYDSLIRKIAMRWIYEKESAISKSGAAVVEAVQRFRSSKQCVGGALSSSHFHILWRTSLAWMRDRQIHAENLQRWLLLCKILRSGSDCHLNRNLEVFLRTFSRSIVPLTVSNDDTDSDLKAKIVMQSGGATSGKRGPHEIHAGRSLRFSHEFGITNKCFTTITICSFLKTVGGESNQPKRQESPSQQMIWILAGGIALALGGLFAAWKRNRSRARFPHDEEEDSLLNENEYTTTEDDYGGWYELTKKLVPILMGAGLSTTDVYSDYLIALPTLYYDEQNPWSFWAMSAILTLSSIGGGLAYIYDHDIWNNVRENPALKPTLMIGICVVFPLFPLGVLLSAAFAGFRNNLDLLSKCESALLVIGQGEILESLMCLGLQSDLFFSEGVKGLLFSILIGLLSASKSSVEANTNNKVLLSVALKPEKAENEDHKINVITGPLLPPFTTLEKAPDVAALLFLHYILELTSGVGCAVLFQDSMHDYFQGPVLPAFHLTHYSVAWSVFIGLQMVGFYVLFRKLIPISTMDRLRSSVLSSFVVQLPLVDGGLSLMPVYGVRAVSQAILTIIVCTTKRNIDQATWITLQDKICYTGGVPTHIYSSLANAQADCLTNPNCSGIYSIRCNGEQYGMCNTYRYVRSTMGTCISQKATAAAAEQRLSWLVIATFFSSLFMWLTLLAVRFWAATSIPQKWQQRQMAEIALDLRQRVSMRAGWKFPFLRLTDYPRAGKHPQVHELLKNLIPEIRPVYYVSNSLDAWAVLEHHQHSPQLCDIESEITVDFDEDFEDLEWLMEMMKDVRFWKSAFRHGSMLANKKLFRAIPGTPKAQASADRVFLQTAFRGSFRNMIHSTTGNSNETKDDDFLKLAFQAFEKQKNLLRPKLKEYRDTLKNEFPGEMQEVEDLEKLIIETAQFSARSSQAQIEENKAWMQKFISRDRTCLDLTHYEDSKFVDDLQKLTRKCKFLTEIVLSCCDGVTADCLKEIAQNCPDILKIQLSETRIDVKGITELGRHCRNLQELGLEGCNHVDDKFLKEIARNFKEIHIISLSRTNVSDDGIKEVGRNCTKLLTIKLEGCRYVSAEGILEFARNCKDLRDINISGCTGVNDMLVKDLATARDGLMGINVACSEDVTDVSVMELGRNCKNLNSINLDGTGITDESVKGIGRNCHVLEVINLSRTAITGTGLEELAKQCKFLKEIRLSKCKNLTSESVRCLGQHCNRLQIIDLKRSFCVTDTAVKELKNKLPGASIIDPSGFEA